MSAAERSGAGHRRPRSLQGLCFTQARLRDCDDVAAILAEAAAWAEERHGKLWIQEELDVVSIRNDVGRGEFFLGRIADGPISVLRYQLIDREFWPDSIDDRAAYVHRLAVRRRYAGQGVAAAMLGWAAARARSQGLEFLRLDTDLDRPKLRALYLSCGFREHSEWRFGPYRVMRYEQRLR